MQRLYHASGSDRGLHRLVRAVVELNACAVFVHARRLRYNTRLKPLLVVAVTLWLVSTFVLRSSSHNVVTPLHNGSQPMWVSHSRDAGLQMTLRQPIPPYLLQLHSVAGALLLVGCIVQKQLVVLMATNPRAYAFLHRLNGCLCLLCMICMFVGGYMMGPYRHAGARA